MKNLLHKAITLLFLALFLFLSSSCSRRGCMDTAAENYEPKANEDCQCCYYSALGLVWYNKNFYDRMMASGATQLNYYANDQLVGHTKSYIPYYTSSAPTLEHGGKGTYSFNHTDDPDVMYVNLGNEKIKTVFVKVTDQNGNVLWQNYVTFSGSDTITIELS